VYSPFLFLHRTMENTPFIFLPQEFTHKILRYQDITSPEANDI